MRLECDVVMMREGSSGLAAVQQSKASRGIVTLGKNKMKGGRVRYLLNVATRRCTKGTPIEVTAGNVKQMHLQRVSSGRASLIFKEPNVSVIIMKSNPTQLERFVSNFQNIVKGEDVSLKSLESVKMSDFKACPKALLVTADNLRGISYPSSLVKLEVIGLDIRMIDCRWFSLPNLIHLDLSRNRLGSNPGFVRIKLVSRLTSLAFLSLENNEIEAIPPLFFESLPRSLRVLNLASNNISYLPRSVTMVQRLHTLILSRNHLKKIPRDMSDMRLTCLFIDNNQIKSLPYDIRLRRHEKFYCDSNPFNTILVHPSEYRSDRVTSLTAYALAAARHFELPLNEIPWDLMMVADELAAKCSLCRKWTPAQLLTASPISKGIDFTEETDYMSSVPFDILACQKCCGRLFLPVKFAQSITDY